MTDRLEGLSALVAVNHPDEATREAAEAVVAGIRAAGGEAVALRADVSREDEAEALVAAATQAHGPIDVLVSNAGVAVAAPLHETSAEDWDRVIAVHLRGAFLVARRVLPGMYGRRRGRVLFTASQLAYKGAAGFAAYTAAKGALISLTRTLALEAADTGVTVNAIAPGATMTPMLADVPEAILDKVRADIPLGRIAEVADIVPTYVFLASEEGRHYQGQCLSPNGGDVFL
ncbi:MAG: SDR family NAD(P)-dependent oxidoreductase [Paracoccaceae bacterium]